MNLAHWIDRHAGFTPGQRAVCFEGEALSYRDLATRIAATARLLRRAGVEAGDRVAYLGYNHPAALALLFACARLRAIFVPLNWRLAPPELARVASDCTPRAVFIEPRFADAAERLSAALAPCVPFAVGDVPAGWRDGNAIDDAAVAEDTFDTDAADAPVLLCYTSGSTGAPKGALLTQQALFVNAVNSTQMHDLTRADRVLTTLPLFHVGGLCIQTLPALHAGATVFLHPKFDAVATLGTIAREAITLTVLVPAQLDALAAAQHHDRLDDRSHAQLRNRACTRRAADPGVRIDGDGPDCHLHDRGRCGARGGRGGAPGHPLRRTRRRRRRSPARVRRERRNPRQGRERDVGLLECGRRDRGDARRRLVPYRRYRPHRWRRAVVGRRPAEGHDHLGRGEHLPGRNRERARRMCRHRGGRDRRPARRHVGRGGRRGDRAA